MLAVGRQDNDIDLVILRSQIKGGIEFVRHFAILSVARFVPTNDDPCNAIFDRLISDGFKRLTHNYPLCVKAMGLVTSFASRGARTGRAQVLTPE